MAAGRFREDLLYRLNTVEVKLLAPIRSIADSQRTLLSKRPLPADWEEDVLEGLDVIARRSEALGRFMASYASLARLPPPKLGPVRVSAWVRRVAGLETRLPVEVSAGPDVTLEGDGDQLDQLLINLIKNAVDAAQTTGGGVSVGWSAKGGMVEVWVDDEGPGLPESGNLFVPFFTTKPNGSGIGLLLSRQIAEAHGGSLDLRAHRGGRGCRALLRVPMERPLPRDGA